MHPSDPVTIIPGGGWLAHHAGELDRPDSPGYTTPVVAWGLKANGFVELFVWRGDEDRIMQAKESYITLYHPDDQPRPDLPPS